MKGILYSQYKSVEEYINKLHVENVSNTIIASNETLLQHKEKLKNIYESYKSTFDEITSLVKEFEAHKLAVRKLLIMQNKKNLKKQKTLLPILNRITSNISLDF